MIQVLGKIYLFGHQFKIICLVVFDFSELVLNVEVRLKHLHKQTWNKNACSTFNKQFIHDVSHMHLNSHNYCTRKVRNTFQKFKKCFLENHFKSFWSWRWHCQNFQTSEAQFRKCLQNSKAYSKPSSITVDSL